MKSLATRIYTDPVYTAAARLIGYGGCSPFEFFDAAKLLPIYDERKFRTAMFDLTRTDRREASPPRYEFNHDARKACWMLLGPPPEHPLFKEFEEQRKRLRKEQPEPPEEKPKRARKPRKKK